MATLRGVTGHALDSLAVLYLLARIGQSVVHVAPVEAPPEPPPACPMPSAPPLSKPTAKMTVKKRAAK